MLTYAAVNLSVCPENLALWIEENFPLSDPAQRFRQAVSPRLGWALPAPLPRVRPGRLYWPKGASRWAVAYMLATQSQLDAIRKAVFGTTGQPGTNPLTGPPSAQPLVFDDGTGRVVTTSLWMLPARQFTSSMNQKKPPNFDDSNSMYLLELVDDRYFWWFRSGQVTVTEGTTTWAQLIGQIGTLLGITIAADAVDPAFLFPAPNLGAWSEPLPPLLDCVAGSVGMRVVRQLSGTVEMLSAATSLTRQAAEITAARSVYAGGLVSLGA